MSENYASSTRRFCARLKALRFYLGVVFYIGSTVSVIGQSDTISSSVQLDTVVISVGRLEVPYLTLPASVSTIDLSKKTHYTSHTDLSEAVSQVPGLFALNGQNYAQDLRISLRGFGARSAFGIRGVKLIVDGVPETTPDGQGQLDNVSVADITSIQVMQGTSGSQYGNAAGGVISLSTDRSSTKNATEASFRLGSFGLQQYRLNTSQNINGTQFYLSGTHQRSNGYRGQSKLVQTNLLAKLSKKWGDQQLKWSASLLSSPTAQDPGGINLEQAIAQPASARDRNVSFDAGEEITHWKTSVKYDNELNDHLDLSTTAFYSGRSFDGRLPFAGGGAIDLNRKYGGLMLQLNHKEIGNNFVSKGSYGIDLLSQRDNRDRFDNNEGIRGDATLSQIEKFDNIGLYLIRQFGYKLWTLRGSARYDINKIGVDDAFLSDGDDTGSESLNAFSYSIAANYNYSAKQSIFLNHSTSFETPTLSELSANPSGAGGFNSDLKPSKASTIELGIKRSLDEIFSYAVTIFHIATDDESLPFEVADQPGRTFFRNAGKTKRTGLELSATVKASKALSLQWSYAYSNFKFDDFTLNGDDLSGIRLPGIPQHSLSSSITYDHNQLYIKASSQYFSSISVRNDNTVAVDPYHIVNLRFGYELQAGGKTIRPFVGINNLLSSTYYDNLRLNAFGSRYYEPAAGVNWQAGLGVLF